MLSHSDLRKGVQLVIDGEPYEVLEANAMKKAQRRVTIQGKLRNLITGTIVERNIHQGETFDEANIEKVQLKFIYANKGAYVFADPKDPSKRFQFTAEQVGPQAPFLSPNTLVDGLMFEEKIITFSLPIKMSLRVKETPPGVKGDRAQGGTKTATLETGAVIQVPLFVEEGDLIEVNTQTGEYARRVQE
ncbi:MAG: elongation factor P [bacterium]|nr:elongation factor P [bacterium]